MSDWPRAFHITFGTYGTRLHGDERCTVDRSLNRPGDPIVGRTDDWRRFEAARLKHPPVVLTWEQRRLVEAELPAIAERGGWELYACAAGADHVHALLSTNREPKPVRQWLKRWLGEALSSRWPRPVGATWWAECGSIKWVWDQQYLENVYAYVLAQRTTK